MTKQMLKIHHQYTKS